MEKESKFAGGVPDSKLKAPPNSCMPNSAKMSINRKSRRRSDTIDFIDAKSDTTKFLNDDQYLKYIFNLSLVIDGTLKSYLLGDFKYSK